MQTETKTLDGKTLEMGKLSDNGGDTLTIMPTTALIAAPADRYSAANWNTPNDQRGVSRPITGMGTYRG